MKPEVLLARHETALRNLDAARQKLEAREEVLAKLEFNTAWRRLAKTKAGKPS